MSHSSTRLATRFEERTPGDIFSPRLGTPGRGVGGEGSSINIRAAFRKQWLPEQRCEAFGSLQTAVPLTPSPSPLPVRVYSAEARGDRIFNTLRSAPRADSLQIFVALLLIVAGVPTAVRGAGPDFVRDIRPILAEHCLQCHGPDEAKRKADLRLDLRAGAIAPLADGGAAIVPGKAAESELVLRIESDKPEEVMPPPRSKRQLTPQQKKLLRQWVDAGAPYATHWAYQKPVRAILPATKNATWSRNEIDRFVLAKLEAAGLQPSAEADRTTLIRRLSFDLTGLPPTIAEQDLFLNDTRPDAYERLVDRLLVSPHYGEKLGQDWLDLARFGDSTGYSDDGERLSWPYRDYVINAFNSNMPFDQFTVENLAGDLLPNATLTQKVASGFNRLHRHNEEGGSDPEEFRVVYAVDRTSTTATAWMGLTFGCAQCHDHKYDPFSQREFYQFFAFFNSLKGEVPVTKGPYPPQIRVPNDEDQQRLAKIDGEVTTLERQVAELQPAVDKAFAAWQTEPLPATVSNAKPTGKTGAAGGLFARTRHKAFFADTRLASPLLLDQPLRASGRITIVRSVNNVVDIGHFSSSDVTGTEVGFSVAEGPRFFGYLSLGGTARSATAPIHAEHGVDYTWTYTYDPTGGADDPADADQVGEGLLTFELLRAGKSLGVLQTDLSAAHRAIPATLDAFGIAFRGFDDADSPISLYIDDVDYTVGRDGASRKQDFSRDPEWTGKGNAEHGHRFGFDPTATTAGGAVDLTIPQILALAPDKRSVEQTTRLREHFIQDKFPKMKEVQSRLAALKVERDALEKTIPSALVWEEMDPPRPAHLLIRGDYQGPGDVVERNVPAIFPRLSADKRDRMTLAKWLVSGEHPLTARVAVNRFWKQCFGAGLVRTPEDFGVRGELPTHPELLDWLALEFSAGPEQGRAPATAQAWNTKHLLRLIVTSATYRQSSLGTKSLREHDPDNRLLARASRFRLAAEEIRDVALVASGLLTRKLGGRSVYPYQPDYFYREKEDDPGEWKWPLESGPELYRRGLYTFIRRTTPYQPYQIFDAPSRGECLVARTRTNTPLQALITMNDPGFVEASRVLGERIATVKETDLPARLTFAFRSVLSRQPTDRERQVLMTLYQTERERYQADPKSAAAAVSHGKAPHLTTDAVDAAAWTAVATALLNLDEAITRE